MQTRTIAVVGIDGTGKTTVVREISRQLAARNAEVRAFRALQLYDDPDLPLCNLSRGLDLLSALGDELKQPALKGVALFLGMTLYGPAERFVISTHAPHWLVTERHPLIDAITYSKFYAPLVTAPIDRNLEGVILDRLARMGGDPKETLLRIESWVAHLPAFDGAKLGFWDVSLALRELFLLPPNELLEKLRAIFQTDLPTDIALLTASADSADARIGPDGAAGRNAARELHEQRDILAMLQDAYYHTCNFLRATSPQTAFYTLDTDALNLEQVMASLLRDTGVMAS